jgi:hypothetical protein
MLPAALADRRRPTVLAFVDLVQDIDVMAPLLAAIQADGRLRLRICVSRWLERESPRTAEVLTRLGLGFSYVRRREVIEGRAPSLRGVSAVISASESSHLAHAAAHALARRAEAAGVKSYALQHGFENAGLFGIEAETVRFASGAVFCWFPAEAADAELSHETRSKLAHVGRPRPLSLDEGPPAAAAYDVGVFENLHWERYTDADRAAFRKGLLGLASACPDTRILLRSHPAGAWADRELGHELAQFHNITRLGGAEARRQLNSGADLMKGLARVITTPSTIALDAAQAGRPVALAVSGGDAYAPLPVLTGPGDWVSFASGEAYDPRSLDQFLSRVLVAGDGAPRIIERLSRDYAGKRGVPHE